MKRLRNLSVFVLSACLLAALLSPLFPLSVKASYLKGDINHNGMLDSKDALLIQRYCIGLIQLSDEEQVLADYNRDYKVSSKDVLSVLRCVIGLDHEINLDDLILDLELVEEVLDLVNVERIDLGLKPLLLDPNLCNVAQLRSEELVKNFSHTRPNGSMWFTALQEADFQYNTAAENIAGGYHSVDQVVEGWMNSEGHRKNMMSGEFTKVGLGFTYQKGSEFGNYWDILFTDGDSVRYDHDQSSDSDNNANAAEFASEVTKYVNIERENVGLQPLELDENLCRVANMRAVEIVQSFSHERPDGTSWYTLLREENIPYHIAGENIAAGFATPEKVVNAWMKSEGHRANILSSDFKKIGIGFYYEDGTVFKNYWDQIFTDGADENYTDENADVQEDNNSFANEVVRLVNEERQKAGLSPLEADPKLAHAAQKRSDELIETFGHERPDGQPWSTILEEENISYSSAGENVAAGFSTPEKVVKAWMNSEGHKKAILSTDYKKIGVGYSYTDNADLKHYWDQLFTD